MTIRKMTAQERARAFLTRMFEALAHGDPKHREWLKQELMKFETELTALTLDVAPSIATAPRYSKIKDGGDLDWMTAERAARSIVKQCEAAQFAPPEATSMHLGRIELVCAALNSIVDSLRIRREA